jgi:hypothetical protein
LSKDVDILDAGKDWRGALNGTVGAEFTGQYFDLRNPNRAFVNIQHPDSDVDRLIEISTSTYGEVTRSSGLCRQSCILRLTLLPCAHIQPEKRP